jgi:hypothetical protein
VRRSWTSCGHNRIFFHRQWGQWLRQIRGQIDGDAAERSTEQRAICQARQRRKGQVEQGRLQELAEGERTFLEKMAVAIHITYGQPAMAEELAMVMIKNKPSGMRRIYWS